MTKVMNINKEETTELDKVQDVEVKTEETKTPRTLEELEAERESLVQEVDQDGKDLTSALYEIDFVDESNISTTMKYIDKNLDWTIKEAALYVELYKNLKSEKNRIKEATEDTEKLVRLNHMNLNTLYTSITKIEGRGMSQAKVFLTLLTNVGNAISTCMNTMADNNKLVQSKHVILQELETEIERLMSPTIEADEIIEDKS